jgi:hypothetical protein
MHKALGSILSTKTNKQINRAAIINMLEQAFTSSLEINVKVGSFANEEDVKKKGMEVLTLAMKTPEIIQLEHRKDRRASVYFQGPIDNNKRS